jgi:uncharacterized protein YgbK (DUF1537 family)
MGLLIIADDLTGANDSAVQFTNAGFSAATLLNLSAGLNFEKYGVIAISSETRTVGPDKAYQMVRTICSEVGREKTCQVFKKIDSSLRGYIGVEVDALMDEYSFDLALVVPAYPTNGRITSGGYHLVNQIPIGESDIQKDPVTPVKESNLIKLLEKQTKRKVGYLSLEILGKGLQAVLDEIQHLCKTGKVVIACDTTSNHHLDILGKAVINLENALACGTAGLARAIAHLVNENIISKRKLLEKEHSSHGGILGICGSQSSASRVQIEYAHMSSGLKVIEINPSRLIIPELFKEEVLQVSGRAIQVLKQNGNCLIYIGSADERKNSRINFREVILAALASITQQIIAQIQIRGLVLTGGDTARTVCQSLNVDNILIEGEIFSGIVKGRLVGGLLPERTLITKSGSFGERETLVRLFNYV